MNCEVIDKLKTPEDCEQFASNVEKRGNPELAVAARRRAVELRAAASLSVGSPISRQVKRAQTFL